MKIKVRLLALVVLFLIGMVIDWVYITNFSPPPNDRIGHPAPFFYFILPIAGLFIILLIDVILLIKKLISAIINRSKK